MRCFEESVQRRGLLLALHHGGEWFGELPGFDESVDYDLVVLGYQTWYLSPSLPTTGFLKSRYAKVLKGKTIGIQGVGSIIHAWQRFVAARGGLRGAHPCRPRHAARHREVGDHDGIGPRADRDRDLRARHLSIPGRR